MPSVKKETKKIREMEPTIDLDEAIPEMREKLEDFITQRGADGAEITKEKLDQFWERLYQYGKCSHC